jgi:hypothetical protein
VQKVVEAPITVLELPALARLLDDWKDDRRSRPVREGAQGLLHTLLFGFRTELKG